MKNLIFITLAISLMACSSNAGNSETETTDAIPADTINRPTVYFTSEITPESLIKIFEQLGVEPTGNVAVKISTGEGGNTHYLKPELIGQLVNDVDGTIVECCTAYGAHVRILLNIGKLSATTVSTAPEMKDLGIAASINPVALDQACLDMVFTHTSSDGDTPGAHTPPITYEPSTSYPRSLAAEP